MIFTIPDYFSLLCKKDKNDVNDVLDKLEYIFSKYYLESIAFYHMIKGLYKKEYIDDIEYIQNKKLTSLKLSIKLNKNVKVSDIKEKLEKSVPDDYILKIEHSKRNLNILLKRKKNKK